MQNIELFLKQVEELLEARRHGNINETTFISRGHELIVNSGFTQKEVYLPMLKRHELYMDVDELKGEWLADLMDFVVGWCSPRDRIWNSEEN